MSGFSGALQLADLNDYIAPSQACIKPVDVPSKKSLGATVTLDEATRTYYEVSKEGDVQPLTESASITLDDCLACSGCVTSAESVLVAQQSHQQVLDHVRSIRATPTAAGAMDAPPPPGQLVVTLSQQSIASLAAKYALSPATVARKVTWFATHVLGAMRVLDVAFFRDVALTEAAHELVDRYHRHHVHFPRKAPTAAAESAPASEATDTQPRRRVRGRRGLASQDSTPDFSHHALPMLASACPGWICYAEKTQGYVLPLISSTKSPQQIAGAVVRSLGDPNVPFFHVAVMPCYDKKLEASRSDFYNEQLRTRDIDCVITTTELVRLFTEAQQQLAPESSVIPFVEFPEAPLDPWFRHDPTTDALIRAPGSSSGGYLEYLLYAATQALFGINLFTADAATRAAYVQTTHHRNADFTELTLTDPATRAVHFRFAAVYGFKNIQNVLRKLKSSDPAEPVFHYVEVMACPSGCVNGGGQLPVDSKSMVTPREWVATVHQAYETGVTQWAHENTVAAQLVESMFGSRTDPRARAALHTQYRAVEATVGISAKW
ncbi:hypothetical protein AMAG_08150 [Allomyces macrogynus ATCC 38327]|uniref:Iron hydrogenase large subunit C-terminal domain-containing protein n=1 Tax=Allomyces macrogynus (strain ATCC 38327) TaxID=578462 RepID=A0A0L0SKT4_ALLM3|nr:hypothetical protein AMAG_08150 [Allomyces macrogynus ATCC 38327]|eukprot:KNE62980.1 hypothetical protein AMAG_08150 [Allomyces macrogynus ATCC 38327]